MRLLPRPRSGGGRRRKLGFWRENLWLLPTLIVVGALAMFIAAQSLDHAQYDGRIRLPAWIDQGGASDARDLLSATAGAIITTLGLVLSITVLTLQIAATTFGQRLLRRFMRDRGTQVSIGIFAATFVFSLLTLLSVTSRSGEREFVPWLSAWVSTFLALACIAVLIYFINHVAMSIQVNSVVASISEDLHNVVEHLYSGEQRGTGRPSPLVADFVLRAPASGYLQLIDYRAVTHAAEASEARIQFLVRPGQFLIKGAVVATGSYDDHVGGAPNEVPRPLADVFERAFTLGSYRALIQDPEFAINQIVEIALRAMSPAVNDPFTMLTCVDWLGEGFRLIAETPSPSPIHVDTTGTTRVIERPNRFERLLAAAFDPLRQVARGSPAATIRMLETCRALAPHLATGEQVAAVAEQVELIREGFDPGAVSRDRADVEAAYDRALRAIELHPPKRGPAL